MSPHPWPCSNTSAERFGRTALDGNGYLSSIANPKGELVRLYTTTLGLLDSLADPRGKLYRFEYDARGRLTKDSDPAGGSKTLVRTEQDTSYTVALSTELGRTTRYQVGEAIERCGLVPKQALDCGLGSRWL